MRAAYLEDLKSQESYELRGDLHHHLVNVVRIESGEELLLLNGCGLKVRCRVKEVSKKSLHLDRISEEVAQRGHHYDLALGTPKKDALELSLKEAVELGFRRIFLVRGSYSQNRIPESERMKSLLVSALEQSNNAFMPDILESTWESVPWNDYGTVLCLDSKNTSGPARSLKSSPVLLVVGPEGGFSPEESQIFGALPHLETLLLPTPILRTPTAVAAGAGVILQRLMS